jgi:hypothetical protein
VRKGNAQEGSASILVLVMLVLLTAAAGGCALLLNGTLSQQHRSAAAYALRRSLEGEAERVVAALASDPTPQSDSSLDPVWSAIQSPAVEGASLALADASSALDPNWAQKNVFSKTGLKALLKAPGNADVLQQRREDKGFFMDFTDAYGDLFVEGALEKHFTAYGYANINVTDEFALRKLYALRTGDAKAAEAFHGKIQQLLTDQKILKPEELRTFLGSAYDALFPTVNAEPIMNVHFVDALTLTELLAYPDLKVPHPSEVAQAILNSRERSELSSADMKQMIGASPTSRIYQYLGVTTWFWRITASKEKSHLEMIVARVPGSPDAPAQFSIVEERFSRS